MTAVGLLALLLGLQVTISDLAARRVSNGVLAVTLALVLSLQLSHNAAPVGLASCLAGGVLGLLVLLPFHVIGWMGAGDVKLFATIGFLLGTKALLPIWVIASLAAGVHALLVVAWPLLSSSAPGMQRRVAGWGNTGWIRDWRMDLRSTRQGRRGIPYAAYLGLAMIGYVLQGSSHG